MTGGVVVGGSQILESGVGADANPIGSPWVTDPLAVGWGDLKRLTNQIVGAVAGHTGAGAYRNDVTYAANCESAVTPATLDAPGNSSGISAMTRVNPTGNIATAQAYQGVISGDGASAYTVRCFKRDSSAFTQVGTTDTTTGFVANDTVVLTSVGSAHQVWVKRAGVWVKSANAAGTDTTITAGGRAGLEVDGGWACTNFQAGNLAYQPAFVSQFAVRRSAIF